MAARFGLALNSKTFAVIVWTICDLRGKVFADLADMGLPGAGSLQYCMGQIGAQHGVLVLCGQWMAGCVRRRQQRADGSWEDRCENGGPLLRLNASCLPPACISILPAQALLSLDWSSGIAAIAVAAFSYERRSD